MVLNPTRIPLATYRLQFSAHLRFDDARRLVGYLSNLGITDAYPSPLFRAREHSSHGYDVVDHATIDPDFGTESDFRALAEELQQHGMGLMMDVVPNHMGIDDPYNAWWQDVMENGTSSTYAKYFDIDWYPPKETLREKVLLPFLGEQYGKVLENQELKLTYDDQRFQILYYDRCFPVAPRTWRLILELALEKVAESLTLEDPDRMELESILTALQNLPPRTEKDPDRIQQRYREKEVIRRRLATLHETSAPVHQAIDQVVAEFNGRRGEPRSFDRLESLLAEQAYRLSYWRVAMDEINYRRFFDINALAAIRVEDPEVFQAVHRLIFRFLEQGWVTALRIDHPDGLLDPLQYFADLQEGYLAAIQRARPADIDPAEAPSLYVAVEKILEYDEAIPMDWPVCGTTGYEFLNRLNGVFVDRRGAYALQGIYLRFTGQATTFSDVLYESKRTILSVSMSSELYVLAGQLDRISEQHRWSRDFTRSSLHRALREVIACFPVYRTYIRPGTKEVSAEDRRRIVLAIRAAKRRNPAMSTSFFDFIGSVLLLEHPDGLSEAQEQERLSFVLKFQQVTGPVMAKGLEDTAFYRFYPLASLNEVGGDPTVPGIPVEQFHRDNIERRLTWPYSMSATATHDTKRGEDVRARLNVLSEIPEEWDQAIRRWQGYHQELRVEIEGDGTLVPNANEEYLLYQTLVGTWPQTGLTETACEQYCERIVTYMDKALKESKLRTSWVNPDEKHDQAVAAFTRAVLDPHASASFLEDLGGFVRFVADAGWTNSLAQCLLKICSPGVPDFYQGTELWDLSLVDPDNRRPVDFQRRQDLLAEIQARADDNLPAWVDDLLKCWPDERIKLFVIWRALAFRRANPELFLRGDYLPLTVEGPRSEHVCAMAREREGRWAIAAVPRFTMPAWRQYAASAQTSGSHQRHPGLDLAAFASWWTDTSLRLPPDAPDAWCHVITGEHIPTNGINEFGRSLSLADLFRRFPVTLIEA